MRRIIYDGDSFYELDEECMRKKEETERREETERKETEKRTSKPMSGRCY